jgi:hypothetical protein
VIYFQLIVWFFLFNIKIIPAQLTGKRLPISCIRVKKFIGTTQFASSVASTGFVAPVKLEDAIDRTLRYEFIEDNSDKPVFLTE